MVGRSIVCISNSDNLTMKLAYRLQGCVYVFNSFVEHFAGGGKVITMLVEAIGKYHSSLRISC